MPDEELISDHQLIELRRASFDDLKLALATEERRRRTVNWIVALVLIGAMVAMIIGLGGVILLGWV